MDRESSFFESKVLPKILRLPAFILVTWVSLSLYGMSATAVNPASITERLAADDRLELTLKNKVDSRYFLESIDRVRAFDSLLRLYLRRDRKEEAVELATRLKEILDGSADLEAEEKLPFYEDVATAMRVTGRFDQSSTLYGELLGKPETEAIVLNNLGVHNYFWSQVTRAFKGKDMRFRLARLEHARGQLKESADLAARENRPELASTARHNLDLVEEDSEFGSIRLASFERAEQSQGR
ncbi:MAG: hypothetical protein AB7W16_27580 [Candidatus Obscuribacterales bacterium]